MLFHNQLIQTAHIPDTAIRVPFCTLQEGDRYTHTPGGNELQVTRVEAAYRTVRRWDGWLLHLTAGCWSWDVLVIKL